MNQASFREMVTVGVRPVILASTHGIDEHIATVLARPQVLYVTNYIGQ
jgi:hypothetical protein